MIRFWEGGGGGWQDPRTRPPDWVLEDVIDGFVSLDAARDVYGVAVRMLDEDAALYEVDQAGTERLRKGAESSDLHWPGGAEPHQHEARRGQRVSSWTTSSCRE